MMPAPATAASADGDRTGEGGWVDLAERIIVRAGEAFIAVPEPDDQGNPT